MLRKPTRGLGTSLAFLLTLTSASALWAGGGVVINEIRIDQSGADDDEFFELVGVPGQSLDNHAYIVIGDGTGGSGVIESVTDLTGLSIGPSGYLTVAEATFGTGLPGAVADVTASLNFENSDNVTHLLVVFDPANGAPVDGDDLDADDDGVIDFTIVDADTNGVPDYLEGGPGAWVTVLDSVAMVETLDVPASGELFYSSTIVGPDGTFVPGTIWRCGNGWVIGDFDITLGTNTPGAANTCPAEDCTNGVDDDGDNAVDCDDSDCFGDAACIAAGPAGPRYGLTALGTYATGIFDDSAAEIVAYDPRTGQLFVTNSAAGAIDVLSLSSTGTLSLAGTITATGSPTHVRIWDDGVSSFVVCSVPNAADSTLPGTLEVYTPAGALVASYPTGALPDMVYVTSTGLALTADEGEPNAIDPPGSVTIVDLVLGTTATVSFAGFDGNEAALRAQGVRLFPGVPASADLEPEYIAVSPDETTAYAVCQEQNAVIVIDIATATATSIIALGTKDHSLPGNGLDASDRDDGINIQNWPVRGLYMPDSAVAFEAGGNVYLLTANEGDDRGEDERVNGIVLDPTAFPNAAELQQSANLGRLGVSSIDGDTDDDGDYDELYSYGARSFTIFDMTAGGSVATVTYDSGDIFEQVIADREFYDFGSTNDENGSFEDRSDNKGPEPEAATIGFLNGRTLAFLGMERQSGIFIFDVTDPANSQMLSYTSNRDFAGDAAAGTAGDLGPEGLVFVPADQNPTGKPILLAANEVSGTTTVFEIVDLPTNELRIEDRFAPSGQDFDVSISLDMYAGDASAYSYGVCHDPTKLDIVAVTDGADLPLVPGGETQFNQVNVTPTGFSVAVVVCLTGCVSLPAGYDAEINVATYDALGRPGTTTTVDFCDTIGSPAVDIVVTVGGDTLTPATDSGLLTFFDPPSPFNVIANGGTGTYDFNGLGTASTTISLAQVDGGAAVQTTGFSFGLGNESGQLTPTAVSASGALLTLPGGTADFFQPTLLANGITLGVIYDFSSTGGGLGDTLAFDTEQEIATVDYDLTGTLVGQTGAVVTPLTFREDLGSPAVANVITVVEGTGTAVIALDGVDGEIVLTPAPPPFRFAVIDGTGSYDLAGNGTASAQASIEQIDGAPIATTGFSMSVASDAGLLAPTGVTALGDLAAVAGGAGPDFLQANLLTGGITVGVIYDFSSTGGGLGETITFAGASPVLAFDYALTGTLAGSSSTVVTPLDFSNALGAPPVENIVTSIDATYPVDTVGGAITLSPAAPPFTFTAADATAGIDLSGNGSFCTTIAIEQTDGGTAIDTVGFSAALGHDPSLLAATTVNPTGALSTLNGGVGPDFFQATILVSGVTVGVIYDFASGGGSQLGETLAFAAAADVVEVCYLVDAPAGSSTTTPLTFEESLGSPAVENLVTDAAQTYAVATVDGTVTIEAEAAPFLYTAADQSVSGSSFCTDLSIAQVNGAAIATAGFQMAVGHDAAVLDATGATPVGPLAGLDGGAGPDFFDASLLSNGVTIGVIYDNDGVETITYAADTVVVEVCYDVVTASLPTTTTLDFAPLGTPTIENIVAAGGSTKAADGQSGTIDITGEVTFIRSDCNTDGLVDIADGIFTLNWLFQGGPTPNCDGACDSNVDAAIDVADAIFTFTWLFLEGPAPSAPFPGCGPSPSGEDCGSNPGCP
jgi:hypothetical protein